MDILVDAAPLLMPSVGIRRYSLSLLHRLSSAAAAHRYYLSNFVSGIHPLEGVAGETMEGFEARLRHLRETSRPCKRRESMRLAPLRALARWSERRARRKTDRLVDRLGADVFWSPHVLARRKLWSRSRLIATVHDLHYLEDVPGISERLRSLLLEKHPPYVASAARVVAVSEWTASELVKHLGVERERIRVVPNAVDDRFAPIRSERALDRFRRRRGLPDRFLLHVGSIQPRKGLVDLIRAHHQLRLRGDRDLHLVLCGAAAWLADDILREARKPAHREHVTILRDVDDAELPFVYNLAQAVVIPSYLEGFGIPAVEAMACGTPLVASRAGALPEVCGEGAVSFDAGDVDGLADAIARVLEDPALRAELRAAGFERAGRYRWDRSAAALYQVFAELEGS